MISSERMTLIWKSKLMFDGLDKVINDNFPELHYNNLRFTYPPYVLSLIITRRLLTFITLAQLGRG